MVAVYPVVFTPDEKDGGYVVSVPDLECNTQGQDLPDAIAMARDVIGLMCMDMEDDGKALPSPSPLSAIHEADSEIVSLVDVDIAAYRRAHSQRSVRRNVSLPCWLNERAEQAGLNVSAILQAALKQELHIS